MYKEIEFEENVYYMVPLIDLVVPDDYKMKHFKFLFNPETQTSVYLCCRRVSLYVIGSVEDYHQI